jgi:hypothetical protein
MGIAAVEGVKVKHVRKGDWTGPDDLRDRREISGPADCAVALGDELVDFLTLPAYDSLE